MNEYLFRAFDWAFMEAGPLGVFLLVFIFSCVICLAFIWLIDGCKWLMDRCFPEHEEEDDNDWN